MLLQLLLLGSHGETESVMTFRLLLPLSFQNCCSRTWVMLWEWPECANPAKDAIPAQAVQLTHTASLISQLWGVGCQQLPHRPSWRSQEMKPKKFFCETNIFMLLSYFLIWECSKTFKYIKSWGFFSLLAQYYLPGFSVGKKRKYSAALPSIKMRTRSYKLCH